MNTIIIISKIIIIGISILTLFKSAHLIITTLKILYTLIIISMKYLVYLKLKIQSTILKIKILLTKTKIFITKIKSKYKNKYQGETNE